MIVDAYFNDAPDFRIPLTPAPVVPITSARIYVRHMGRDAYWGDRHVASAMHWHPSGGHWHVKYGPKSHPWDAAGWAP